jgi:hypothetical protein
MVDEDTFLTALYVLVDDFCHSHRPRRQSGPQPSLSESEVITLAIFARWSRFSSERDFYRYATDHLRGAFPALPDRSQFNRCGRSCTLIEEMALHLAEVLQARECPYEALDSSAMPVREAKRRGHGWLAGQSDVGWSNSIGWYEGFRLLAAVNPHGVITGFCFSAASSTDQQAAETFFAVRASPKPRLSSVGPVCSGLYVTDKGFEGAENHPPQVARALQGAAYLSTQTQRLSGMAQALEAVGRWHPPDRGDGLRQALQHLRPLAGAAP